MSVQPNVRKNAGDLLWRIGLVGTGLVVLSFASTLWGQVQSSEHPLMLILSFVAWVTGIILIFVALVTQAHSRWTWLVLISLLFVQAGYGLIAELEYTPLTATHTDNEMIAEFAVQALKSGYNPYQWNFSDILRVYRDSGLNLTPFLDGSFQNRVTYPILPTLLLYIFDVLGLGEVTIVTLLFQLLLLILLFVSTPTSLRPLVLLPLFILRVFVSLPLNGVQDVVWSALLVGMILCWKRPIWRAVLFGLAVSFRQQPWSVAPFLIIYLWYESDGRTNRLRRIAHFLGIGAAIFLIPNLPFILADPRVWFLGAFEPSYATFNMFSQGMGVLSQYGLFPFPREFYSAVQVLLFATLLYIHWHHPRVVGQAFWIFPGILFWVFYRGLANYWIYWIPPLLAALIHLGRPASLPALSTLRPHQWAKTAIVVCCCLLVVLALGILYLQYPALVRAAYSLPLETFAGGVSRIKISVTNASEKSMQPRFAVQSNQSRQPLPWRILSGPENLRPNQTGEYEISPEGLLVRELSPDGGGQVVISDAGGDYQLRAVLTIPPEESIVIPDTIRNPQFRFWPRDGNAPQDWILEIPDGSQGTMNLQVIEGRSALQFHAEYAAGVDELPIFRLTQTIAFSEAFDIWVYPTTGSADSNTAVYGLEIQDDTHRLWILFNASDKSGLRSSPNEVFINVRAPQRTWSEQHVDVQALYQRLAWPLPPFSMKSANGLTYPVRQVRLSLIGGSAIRPQLDWVFGPIEQARKDFNPHTGLKEALDHPDQYYVNLGDEYRIQRNYDLAQGAYLRALTYNESNPGGYFGLGQSKLSQKDPLGAIEAFQKALQSGYRLPALVYAGIGQSQYELGKYPDAEQAFRTAIVAMKDDPNNYVVRDQARAFNGMGWTLLQTKRCDEAVLYFEAARLLDTDLAMETLGPVKGLEACQVTGP